MAMQDSKFAGSIVAIVTPFKDGKIDAEAWEKMADWHLQQGTQGIVVCGTTGESATMSHEEHYQAIQMMVGIVGGRIPVIAGAGSNCTCEAVKIARAAESHGADAILSVTPYYNKPTPEGLFLHYRAIRQATKLPIILYNVPGRTGINMDADTVARIYELGGIDSVKEASGNLGQAQEILSRGIPVFSGEDGLTFPLMAMGALGVISVVANFAPQIMRRLCDAVKAGRIEEARKLHGVVHELAKAAFAVTNPIPAKAAVAILGFCQEEYRLPLTQLSAPQKEALLCVMQKHGLI